MNPYLEIVLDFIYYTVYAFLTALRWITYPLKPIWYLLYVFALPFIYIGQFFASAVAYPARKLPGSVVEVCIPFNSLLFSSRGISITPEITPIQPCQPPSEELPVSLSVIPYLIFRPTTFILDIKLKPHRPSTSTSQQPPS